MMTPHMRRFAAQPNARARADQSSYHPYGTGDTPLVMHMQQVLVGSSGIAYHDMTPLIMPDGRMIPATGNSRWYQLYAVPVSGRP